MYLILSNSEKYINKALNYFPSFYINNLKNKNTFEQSIVARYFISKIIQDKYWIKKYLPLTDTNWKAIYNKSIYRCISHKEKYVFIWVNKFTLWLDLEIIKNRDESIFTIFDKKEWDLIWEINIYNFYRIWTAKESLIKLLSLILDDMQKIKLVNIYKEKKSISNINFNYLIKLEFNNKIYKILNSINNRFCLSISF